jgi:hypothetical protein
VEEKQTREVTILDNFLYQPVSDSLDFEWKTFRNHVETY